MSQRSTRSAALRGGAAGPRPPRSFSLALVLSGALACGRSDAGSPESIEGGALADGTLPSTSGAASDANPDRSVGEGPDTSTSDRNVDSSRDDDANASTTANDANPATTACAGLGLPVPAAARVSNGNPLLPPKWAFGILWGSYYDQIGSIPLRRMATF